MLVSFQPGDRSNSFGNHLILGVSGTSLSELDRRLLSSLQPAGIILFKKNFLASKGYEDWQRAVVELIADCAKYAERKHLLVAIDHEGGRVHRIPEPISQFPYALKYAKKAQAVARAMGQELASLGVHLSFAPCADINSNPANPVIGERAFGDTASKVSEAAVEFFKGLSAEKIIACAKHFPGHGDTSTDSHHELPILSLPKSKLINRELVPFQELILAGIPMIMSAHIKFLDLDKYYPATFSQAVIGDLLRGELGFRGVVVSDDLDMQAVSAAATKPEHIGRTFRAGVDSLIISRNLQTNSEHPAEIVRALGQALKTKVFSEEDLFNKNFEILISNNGQVAITHC